MTAISPAPVRPSAVPHQQEAPGAAPSPVPRTTAFAVACALIATWLAAGSTGLLGHPLRHVLTWIFTGAAIVSAWPRQRVAPIRWLVLAGALLLSLLLTPAIQPPVNLAAVLVVIAALAWLTGSRELSLTTSAIAIFVVFRLAVLNIPTVWILADRLGSLLGIVAGALTGYKLSVGQTFGGVDFLVLSGTLYGLWLAQSPTPRARRAAYGALGILVAHFAYLAVLSFVPALLENIPTATREQPNPQWVLPVVGFLDLTLKLDAVAVRQFVPYNLPLLAALFHVIAIALMLRGGNPASIEPHRRPQRVPFWVFPAAAALLAVFLPFVTTFCTPANSLQGKKIVIAGERWLFGNFMKPQHGDYGHLSIGMYGNLQPFIESLGGTAVVTSTLSYQYLEGADALILIYPNKPFAGEEVDRALRWTRHFLGWTPADLLQQAHVDRIWKFVEGGGTLLVMGEHTTAHENVPPALHTYANQVLERTGMRVNFDSATFEVGGWLQSYQTLSHPITAGIEDSRNQFGIVIGASLDVKWPARPVIVGRWGWADPGDEGASASMMGNHHYDAGERLGDMVLVAEQSWGKGRVVAFGDPSNVTNGITIGAHPFNARLYSYLTHGRPDDQHGQCGTPQAAWRQVLGALAAIGLVVLLVKCPLPLPTAGIVLVMSLALWGAQSLVGAAAEIYPDASKFKSADIYLDKDGKTQPGYRSLAYIDNAHLGFYSEESWRPEGTMGLAMNLMRNGYLTLLAPDLKAERLKGASLLVVPAPTRPVTREERETLKDWVAAGNTLILTVGWDQYEVNRDLLADYQFYLERIPLEAFPPDVLTAVRKQKPGWDILCGAASGWTYVFDVRKGDDAAEVTVQMGRPPEVASTGLMVAGVTEKPHTRQTLHAALVKHGYLKPEPLGHFKVPYVGFDNYQAYVRFHAAWGVRCATPGSVESAVGRDGVAMIVWRRFGLEKDPEQWKGRVVLVGDSEFATNKNLENEGGQPFEGMRENADFWRWMISYYVRGEKDWWRPAAPPKPVDATKKSPADDFNLEGK